MKRLTGCMVLLLLIAATAVFATEQGQMPGLKAPDLIQKVGGEEIELGPAKFPKFIAVGDSDNKDCEDYLATTLSGAGICTPSEFTGKAHRLCKPDSGKEQKVPDLVVENLEIPEQYRKTCKILVTWTLRVEGHKLTGEELPYWPELCDPYHGKYKFSFPADTVCSRVKVDEKWSEKFTMEIPENGNTTGGESGVFKSDPTLTCNYMITPDQYPDKVLPAKIGRIEVYWQNNSSMKLVSLAGQRTMDINIMYIGGNPAEK